MEILMDYHLVFIVISFALLILSVLLLTLSPTIEQTLAAMIFTGINYVLCIFNSFAFYRIGLVGYVSDGSIEVNAYEEMYSSYVIFMLLLFINIALFFYGYWIYVRKPWEPDIKQKQNRW